MLPQKQHFYIENISVTALQTSPSIIVMTISLKIVIPSNELMLMFLMLYHCIFQKTD